MLTFFEEYKVIYRFVREIFPQVDKTLEKWEKKAELIPDQFLRNQALSSIKLKRFHCQGGSVYALYPGVDRDIMVRFIVAFQTISDYLDNLCDRGGCLDKNAFYQLHLALIEALSPQKTLSNYYSLYPYHDDGGYLESLVQECRSCLRRIFSYRIIEKDVLKLVSLYSDLQSIKHIAPESREKEMVQWTHKYIKDYRDISPWEFAAATGSTLGVFMLCVLAFKHGLEREDIERTRSAYFPYICGFHILLDYFIDQAEDRNEGDLNFLSYYENEEKILERLTYFLSRALEKAGTLPDPAFHKTIIRGMSALYLSDPKSFIPPAKDISSHLVKMSGKKMQLLHLICKLLRNKKII
ncbi:MAG: tetraprenyl-beta-curcumene synthase family protein [Bacillota bacterium]